MWVCADNSGDELGGGRQAGCEALMTWRAMTCRAIESLPPNSPVCRVVSRVAGKGDLK